MADSSFDVVSKFDKQEIANAVNTAAKEVATRYDFKGVGASIRLSRPASPARNTAWTAPSRRASARRTRRRSPR